MKQCTVCKKWKPLSEFYFNKRYNWYFLECKKCNSERRKKWQQNHKTEERIQYQKEYNRNWHNNNKEKIKKYNKQRQRQPYNKQYYLDHRKRLINSSKKWCKDHLEQCKEYQKKYRKQYYANNRKNLLEKSHQYYKTHSEQIKKCSKKWILNNKKWMRKYQKNWCTNKRATDLKYNLNYKISGEIRRSLKGNKNGRHWETLVGYTLDDLIKRLKKTMPKDYTWNDILNSKLHIDHIVPKSIFNYTKPEHIDFKKCWALINLQLLPAEENLSKKDKITEPFQLCMKI